MGLLKIAAVGALSYVAWQSWQRRASAAAALDTDATAHTDRPLVTDVSDDANRVPDAAVPATHGASAH